MKLFSIALRNLLRNRRRSVTTLLAMIVGASSILIFGGFHANVGYGMQTGIVETVGHLQIQRKDFFRYGSGNPAAYGIVNYQEIIDILKKDPVLAPMINVIMPTLQISGIAGNFSAGVSRTVVGVGVIAEEQNKLLKWNDYEFPLVPRSSPLTGTSIDSAVIGIGVARVLQLCAPLNVPECAQAPKDNAASAAANTPDDIAALSLLEKSDQPAKSPTQIEMLATNAHGAPNVASLNVVKAAPQGTKDLDDLYIGLHLPQAQRLVYGNAPPQATAIVVQLKHTDQVPAARERIAQLMATLKNQPLEIQNFETLFPFYTQSIAMFNVLLGFVSVLIGSIVLFTVGNTMSMAVVERTVEIGTIRAIGLRRVGIRRLFVCEGLLLGIIGATLGVAISLVLAFAINHAGITWIPPGYVQEVPLTVQLWGQNRLIFNCVIGLIIVAVVSAWWPANRASKMNIVDALRHV